MKTILRNILAVCALLFGSVLSLGAKNVAPDGESLNYRVMYKWGFVNKKAGTVNMRVRYLAGNKLKATLTAKSAPWADKLYSVRDTLYGTMSQLNCEPSSYHKITHEGGEYKYDRINYTRTDGGEVTGNCLRRKQKKEGDPITTEERVLTANGLTLDMLSAFYYMRSLPYEEMQDGQKTTLTVFSGKKKELLTITYHRRETLEIDKEKYPAYFITFTFTEEGKKSSDDMRAWISTGDYHIPLKLEGNLPVGKVQCFYVP